jgi:hypothetical protein
MGSLRAKLQIKDQRTRLTTIINDENKSQTCNHTNEHKMDWIPQEIPQTHNSARPSHSLGLDPSDDTVGRTLFCLYVTAASSLKKTLEVPKKENENPPAARGTRKPRSPLATSSLFFADTGITLYLISQLHMNQT